VGGRTGAFIGNWKKLTNGPNILEILQGYKIPFFQNPKVSKDPTRIGFSEAEKRLVDLEVQNMLSKGAIRKMPKWEDQVLSNLFLRDKKDGGLRPIINLKWVNSHIPYSHFKMEGLKNVRDLLMPNDLMVKIDLKDAYFTIPLNRESRKYTAFQWEGSVYEFLVLSFGLAPAPKVFTKIMKIPLAALRRINIRLVLYLDDFLLMGQSLDEILMARDSTIFLLESLGFVINYKKSILNPTQCLEYLGILVNSLEMTFSLPSRKVTHLTDICNQALIAESLTAQKLARITGKLVATMPAITPALLQVRYLQICLRQALRASASYQTRLFLSDQARSELNWWITNLSLRQGKPLAIFPPDMIIASDAATSGGWGAVCQGWKTGGQWKTEEKDLHINELELLASHLAIQTFTKWKNVNSIHLLTDSKIALAYILNQGGTKSPSLLKRAKDLWDYLLNKNITITAEWLPTDLNHEADTQSREVGDRSEWMLDPGLFQEICSCMGQPTIDLFASRISHQLPKYMSLKMDPNSEATDAFQQNWSNETPYAFPPFCLVGRVLQKLKRYDIEMIIITPIWVTQPWYPLLLTMSIQSPLLLPNNTNLLSNPKGEVHPLLGRDRGLQLGAWKVSGDNSKQKAFQAGLLTSSSKADQWAPGTITTAPGRNFQAGVVNGVRIPFIAI
jgi:hypothetical protein